MKRCSFTPERRGGVERIKDLRQRLDVDDVDQSEQEGEPVLHPGHVGEQAALGEHLHHCKTLMFLRKKKPRLVITTPIQRRGFDLETLHRQSTLTPDPPLTSSVWLSKRSSERTMQRTSMLESTRELLIWVRKV